MPSIFNIVISELVVAIHLSVLTGILRISSWTRNGV